VDVAVELARAYLRDCDAQAVPEQRHLSRASGAGDRVRDDPAL
jgi:hypothetical protein